MANFKKRIGVKIRFVTCYQCTRIQYLHFSDDLEDKPLTFGPGSTPG